MDEYVRGAPSPQNAIDIFKGEWASSFPKSHNTSLVAGTAPLFEDPRLIWALELVNGLEGQTVLELGPLEGGHSYILEERGARSITAVEANTRAYLKCLVAKEVLQMTRVRFICGDFVEYLKTSSEFFDFIVASGVLYHMRKPVELLSLLASHTNRIYLWTHYFDPAVKLNPNLRDKFPSQVDSIEAGFRHRLHRFEYQVSLENRGFCGGSETYSNWLNRQDLLNAFSYLGFEDMHINFENVNHPNGPSLALVATKRSK